jgi:ribosomal biogenesis protein LAS1
VKLSPISPLLAQYKRLLKTTTRDTSLKSHFKHTEIQTLRDIEQWVAEAKVAASMVEFDFESQYEEEDGKERWALECLCEALIGRGGLVPVSKRSASESLIGTVKFIS